MKNVKITDTSARLRDLLNETGLRPIDVVNKTGITKASMSVYINGKISPKGDNLIKLANFFNVDVLWLQGFDVAKRKTVALPVGISPLPDTVKKPRLGKISCGVPLDTPENFDGYDDVPIDIRCDYTLVCKGDSMIGARIYDGDIVYIRKQQHINNGEIGVVLVGGTETLLKRVYVSPTSVTLQAENPAYPPLVFAGEQMNDVAILGKAVGFYSKVR